MLSVNQETLEKIIESVDHEIDSSSDIRNAVISLIGDKQRRVDVVMKSIRDTAAYLCRYRLSGKEFSNPFSLINERQSIVAEAQTSVFAGLKGVPLGRISTVGEALRRKLKDELERLQATELFASRTGLTDAVGLAVIEQIKSGQRVNGIGLLRLVHQLAGERIKAAEISKFTSEDSAKLSYFVKTGTIYKFQANRLEKALTSYYHSGNREEILKALEEMVPSRR